MMPIAPDKLIKVNNDVKSCFHEYFKKGYYGARAKLLHEHYLQREKFLTFADKSMNPSLPAIFALYKNWLKMKGGSLQLDTDNGTAGSLHSSSFQKDEDPEEEDFINVREIISKLKRDAKDEYTKIDITTYEVVDDANPILKIKKELVDNAKPILKIKEESVDANVDDRLPIILNYGSVPVSTTSTLPQPLTTNSEQTLTKTMTKQNTAVVAKAMQQPSSQLAANNLSLNTYKVVKCLTIRTGPYSGRQYKSDLSSALLPTRISMRF